MFTPQKGDDSSENLNNSMLSLNVGEEFNFSSPKFGTDSNVFGSSPKSAGDEKIDWNSEPQGLSSEWGRSSSPIEGEDEVDAENLKICEEIKQVADEEFSEEKRAFFGMTANERMQHAGSVLKKLVRKFLKSEMGDTYDSKLKKTYTARLLNESDGDAETQWRFMRNDTFREKAIRKYMQLVSSSPALKGSDSKKEISSNSSPRVPSKEKEDEVSLSKPAFTLDGSTNSTFDALSGSTNSFGGNFDTSSWGGNFGDSSSTTEWGNTNFDSGNTTTTSNFEGGFSAFADSGNQQTFATLAQKNEEKNDNAPATTFTIEGKRGRFEESHAKSAVQEAGDSIQRTCGKVVLSTQSVTEPGARVLATYLSGMKRVVEAELADMISGIPEKEALKSLELVCDALSDIKTLRKVNLSDNALGAKGIRACSSILKKNRNTLTELFLENNGLSAEACRDVADLFLQGNSTPNLSLKTLHFYNNMSGDGGGEHVARLVKRCSDLEDFRLGSTRCLEKGGTALGLALGMFTFPQSFVIITLKQKTFYRYLYKVKILGLG